MPFFVAVLIWASLDAIINGAWTNVSGENLHKPRPAHKKYGTRSFHLRKGTGTLSQEAWQECLDNLAEMEQKWTVSLGASFENRRRGWTLVWQQDDCQHNDRIGEINIALYLLEPLVKNDDFTESERLAQQFCVAKTVSYTFLYQGSFN